MAFETGMQNARNLGARFQPPRDLQRQDELLKQFEAQVGSLKIKPTKAREIDDEESEWGEEAGYILDRIDGSVSFEELFDRTTISTVDAYRIVTDLINQGIIAT